MIDARTITTGQISQTKEMIRQEVLARGWNMWLVDLSLPILGIERSDGKKLRLYGATPPTTSYSAAMVANDKLATQQLFVENALPVPKTFILDDSTNKKAILAELESVVVKPVDAAHGNGVTVDIQSEKNFVAAITRAKQFSDRVLVQEYIDQAIDIRVLCVNYKFCAALIRIPARVIGDGEHPIKDLIAEENNSEKRGLNYTKELNKIDIEKAKQFLGDRIESIPEKGRAVEVVGTANVGTGGETEDITENIPGWLIEMSEKAAKVSELTCCGVDFLLVSKPTLRSEVIELKPKIIEINKSPSLFIHEKPTYGNSQPVVKTFVDYLASL